MASPSKYPNILGSAVNSHTLARQDQAFTIRAETRRLNAKVEDQKATATQAEPGYSTRLIEQGGLLWL